jgi:hypothetical protein
MNGFYLVKYPLLSHLWHLGGGKLFAEATHKKYLLVQTEGKSNLYGIYLAVSILHKKPKC